MNKIILLVIVLVAGWYGSRLYEENKIPFLRNTETTLDLGEKTRCVTKEGRVLYGLISDGTICERREPVEGSITILPGKTINASKSNYKRASGYSCDGRQYCSQMRSRAEAEFFIENCPNTKMDGDHDGIPCENDSRF